MFEAGIHLASSICVPLDVTEYAAFVHAEWTALNADITNMGLDSLIPEYGKFAESMDTAITK